MTSVLQWLASRTPEQLAGYVQRWSGRTAEPRSLSELALGLTNSVTLSEGLIALTVAERQVLSAAVQLAADTVGMPARPRGRRPMPATETLTTDVERLLGALGAAEPGDRRDAALAAVDVLQDHLFLWRGPDGTITVSGLIVHEYLHMLGHEPSGLDDALSTAFNKETIALIGAHLGLGEPFLTRLELQEDIVTLLSQPTKVRRLLDGAPSAAGDLIQSMVESGAALRTTVFYRESQTWNAKYRIDRDDPRPELVWLALRGLIVPTAPGVAEVPDEVARGLRGAPLFAFSPRPPVLPAVDVPVARARGEAQVALVSAVTKLGQLLAGLDAAPVVPRRTGGFPVRETRRLAKFMRVDEIEAIFWVAIARGAGLIGPTAGRADAVVCPTSAADAWSASALPARAASILTLWRDLADIVTWWPADETPIALSQPGDGYAPVLRAATLRVLATLPTGTGSPQADSDGLADTVRAVGWFNPIGADDPMAPERIRHTLREANLLGVVAHGALTDVGAALLTGDDAVLKAALVDVLPSERATARFQADMTVVVAGIPTAQLAALLGAVADRESEGHAVVYRVSGASVRRALDGGADGEELLARLTAVAEGTIPQPIRYLIAEVGRSHGRVRVVQAACCLQSDDESLVAELVKVKSLADLQLRQLAPTVLVSAKAAVETLAALRLAGYAPGLESATGAVVVERARGRRAAVKAVPKRVPRTRERALALATALLERDGGASLSRVEDRGPPGWAPPWDATPGQ